jgi:hypothetical protein
LRRYYPAASVLSLVEPGFKAIGSSLNVDSVNPYRKRKQVPGIGNLLLTADTNPVFRPNHLVFKQRENPGAKGGRRQHPRMAGRVERLFIECGSSEVLSFVVVAKFRAM